MDVSEKKVGRGETCCAFSHTNSIPESSRFHIFLPALMFLLLLLLDSDIMVRI
jgi:hypothetical protein